MTKTSGRTFRLLGAGIAALALTLSACGSDAADPVDTTVAEAVTEETVAATEETVAATETTIGAATETTIAAAAETTVAVAAAANLFDTLPQSIKDAKVVKVGSDITYPPYESFPEGSDVPEGFDVDLATEIGKILGVEFKFENSAFDGLIPAVEAGRYDVILSGMTDNKERQAKIDFVDYQKSGFAILVKKGNPKGIKTPADLCGNKVGMQSGTSQIDFVKAIDCGDKAIEISEFPTEDETRLAVASGRVDADVADLPPMAHFVKTSPQGAEFEISSTEQYETGLLGLAVSKKLPELRDAIQTATQQLMDNGTYDTLLAKWGLEATKITEATVNGG
jgi:polar amino acid transport system substrate-binding protein